MQDQYLGRRRAGGAAATLRHLLSGNLRDGREFLKFQGTSIILPGAGILNRALTEACEIQYTFDLFENFIAFGFTGNTKAIQLRNYECI